MKVNSKRDIPFTSIYTNKTVKKGLEAASSNGALFGAATSLVFSALRPISIWLTPKTEKENREIAAAKSIASSLVNMGLMVAVSIPLANAVKNIDETPQKYLTDKTVKNLKDKGEKLTSSKRYVFATQLFKLGIAALVVIPKSILTANGTPYIAKIMDKKTQKHNDNIPFKGKFSDNNSKLIAKILNSTSMHKLTDKFKDTNFPMHITAMTDILGTLVFMHQTNKSNRIKDDRKKTLLYNSAISTTLSIIGGYTLDKLLEKPTKNFISKYIEINKNDKNLEKQIQGIKIAKPLLILGSIYYLVIPLISTFLAERAESNRKLAHYTSNNL